MYAVIETGGKQYKVAEGEQLAVEKLELEQDSKYTFDKVLLLSDGKEPIIGQPYVAGASVAVTVLGNQKDKKVTVYKYKAKTGYKRKIGHRQTYTVVKIDKISK